MNDDIEKNDGTLVDMDDSVAGATITSVETMMRQALEALRWQRENPDQPLPGNQSGEQQPAIPTKIDISSNVDDVDDTASSTVSETTHQNRSSSSSSRSTNHNKCGRGTLLSLLSVLFAIVCILVIAILLSGGEGGSSSDNANALPNNTNADKTPTEEHEFSDESPSHVPDTPSLEECITPCQSDSDCNDSTNAFGLDEACGDLSCVEGTCQFEAWQNAAPCAQTNYIYCRGNDVMCIRGPTNLSHEATCTGYQNEECVYRWCPMRALVPEHTNAPPDQTTPDGPVSSSTEPPKFTPELTNPSSEDTTVEPISSSTEPPESTPAGECVTPCTQNSDCHDLLNAQGLDEACGSGSCVSGKCQYEAWKDTDECMSSNFATCSSGEDMMCNKGPSELEYEGSCTGFANIVCVYQWCPGIRRDG